jgi:hypothetical protein
MTVALVKQAILAFLKTPTPQVLCIRGKWGVGKTFTWDETFKQAKAEGSVALPYYCYVSLFSLQSIDEVRQTIFENRVTTKAIEIEPNFESLKENVKHYALAAGKQVSKLSQYAKVPYLDQYIANFSGGFRQIVSLAVRDTIICFDDFERKKLSAKDLLGLTAQFREQRGCKAIIILNEDALSNGEKSEFRRYFEKVVDVPIEFAPNPTECADIAIKGTDFVSQHIRENTIALGISNIRIINRIKDVAQDLIRILQPYGDETKHQAIHTLALLVWSKYDDDAIPIGFIAGHTEHSRSLADKVERTEDEKKWIRALDSYQFMYCDKLDLAIMSGIEKGFFDEDELISEAQLQDERQATAASHQALQSAWHIFHSSFDDNVPDVVEVICSTYKVHMKKVSRGSLDEAVDIFRTLGYGDKASELISAYIDAHQGEIKTVDDTANPFHPVVKDGEFRERLAAVAAPPQRKPVKDILIDIYEGKARQDDIDAALTMSADDLYGLFRGLRDDEIHPVIEGALFYRQVVNATEVQREFTKRSVQALEKIGRESMVNAIRVQKFSVTVDADEFKPNPLDGVPASGAGC